ncbi:PAS domain-containing protein [Micromonospora sp. LH3U1]|uniref:PAS domain-containing protein n=1 Tax=Micromonospora sp. LH3U1 TaxID=3018339 RepID=UPI002349177C|nr:PAS domain-containing protein [Micromonospora sp. LH3U1]WCN79528.1 PAS domain-containing protein [Micromonospora sp. LH3U1]
MYAVNSVMEMPCSTYPGNSRTTAPLLPASEISSEEYGDVVLSLFERSGIGLAVLDPALRVRASNDVFGEQCGRPRETIKDHSFVAFLHLSVRQGLLRQFERLVQGRRSHVVCHSLAVRFARTDIAGQLAAFPVDDNNGKVRMIVVQFVPERIEESQPEVSEQLKLTALTAKILEGVAAGDPTVRLAAKLFLSRQGIEYHVSALLRQFKVPNRTALAAKAYSMGIFTVGCWPPKVLPECIRS